MSLVHVPKYTTPDSVKVRLAGKVQFQSDPASVRDGELPNALLAQLIVDAETAVEQDLRGRYAIPFRSKSSATFTALPDSSQRALRVAVDQRAVLEILQTDYVRSGSVNSDEATEALEKRYEKTIKKLLGQDFEGEERERFRFSPPLDDVLLATSNQAADDGYKGMIINTDQSEHDPASFARDHINNPAASIMGRRRRGVIP
jgi:hypothetical protein